MVFCLNGDSGPVLLEVINGMRYKNGEYIIENRLNGKEIWRGKNLKNLSDADLSYANLCGADLRGADLSNAKKLNWNNFRWIPAPIVLTASWGEVSSALCLDLMRYDAFNHPSPEEFIKWANGGSCPYDSVDTVRSANFQEKRELIKEDFLDMPVKSAYELAKRLIEEKNKNNPAS